MDGYDGKIIIGTELDETHLDKKVQKLKSKLEQEEITLNFKASEVEKIKSELKQVEIAMKNIKDANQETETRLSSLSKQYATFNQRIAEGEHLSVEEYQRYGYLENEISKLTILQKDANKELDKYNSKFNRLNDNLTKAEASYNKQLTKVQETRQEYAELNNEIEKTKFKQVEQNIKGIGNSVEKVTKKVGRWALAIFGIRSAYMLIRQAISTLSEHNEKLAADIQNIRYALASALEPLIKRIIELVYRLLGYLAYIIKAWTGKNIFENANKGLKSAVGKAKELQKILAGFDEMNILQDNRSQDSGGGTPSVDLSQIQGDVPGWVDWIARNGKELLAIFGGLAGALVAIKLGLKGIKALGIGVVIAGIVYTIESILDYIKDPSWSNFGDILIGISVILSGLLIIFGGWPLALAAAIVLMLGIMAKFWDKIKDFLTNLKQNIFDLGEKIKNWLYEKLGDWGRIIGIFVDTIVGVVTSMIDGVLDLFGGLFDGLKGILDGIISIFKEGIGTGLVKIFKGALNIIIGLVNFLIDGLNAILSPIRALVVVIGKIMGKDWTMDTIKIPKIPKLAQGGIVHNPGKGVLMGSYIAGEGTSPEAVLPLDDTTLDRLGESIARHMTINANIYNTMNGRVISRELQKINNESNFAYNG